MFDRLECSRVSPRQHPTPCAWRVCVRRSVRMPRNPIALSDWKRAHMKSGKIENEKKKEKPHRFTLFYMFFGHQMCIFYMCPCAPACMHSVSMFVRTNQEEKIKTFCRFINRVWHKNTELSVLCPMRRTLSHRIRCNLFAPTLLPPINASPKNVYGST